MRPPPDDTALVTAIDDTRNDVPTTASDGAKTEDRDANRSVRQLGQADESDPKGEGRRSSSLPSSSGRVIRT